MNDPKSASRTVILSGGVGGARFASGYCNTVTDEAVTIIGNVADDQEFHGLWISPDIDTLTYTLAGIEGPHGWGVAGDTTRGLDMLAALGAPDWMTLGDSDLGLHIFRTQQRSLGVRPTEVARKIADGLGVRVPVLLPTDDRVQTRLLTGEGELDFQTYFVRRRADPEVLEIRFDGIEAAQATPEALGALAAADRIIIAPSNPLVSILPILSVSGISEAVARSNARVIAVSPFIGGKAIKGPAVQMMRSRGLTPDSAGLSALYGDWLQGIVVDDVDAQRSKALVPKGITVFSTNTLMDGRAGRDRLATDVRGYFARLGALAA